MLSYNYKEYSFPNDWLEYRLEDLVELHERPIEMKDNKVYELVTVRRNFGGVDSRGMFYGKDILVKSQFRLKEGDFVISKRQIAHGACGLVPKELENAIVSNEYNVFLPKPPLDLKFFNYYVRLPFMRRYFFLMSDGVHIEKLLFKPQSWLKQKVSLPKYEEQQKISEILLTWDKAIKLKLQLIEETRKQKKGLMKMLLTCEVRFSRFDYKWKKVKLGDVARYESSNISISSIENFDGPEIYPVYSAAGIYKYVDFYNIDVAYISIVKDGAGAGRVCRGVKESSVIGTMGYIINNKDIDFEFLYQYLQLIDYSKYIKGSTIPHVYFKDYKNENIMLPSLQEQVAIASLLKNTDKTIELLEKELELIKSQKKGLMQLLLTGMVRVIN